MNNKTPFIIGISISVFLMITFLSLWLFFYFKKKKQDNFLQKKGKNAENIVNQQTQLWAYKNNGLFIPSTMFKYHGNKIFEVDGILITQRALIALEVKSINAQTIQGKGTEKTWFKILGKETFPIKSPIFQNDKHLDHIYKLTEMKMPMVSLIIFDSNSVTNLDITDVPEHALVIKSNELQDILNTINSSLLPKISSNEVQTIYYKLMEHKTNSNEDRKLLTSYAKEYDEKTFTI